MEESKGSRPDCNIHPATYQEALDLCTAKGKRLCTLQETLSGVTRGKGCGYDAAYQWVSDSCSDPAVRVDADAAALSVHSLIGETSESEESVQDFTASTLGAAVGVMMVLVVVAVIMVIRRRRKRMDDGKEQEVGMSEVVTAPKVEAAESIDGVETV